MKLTMNNQSWSSKLSVGCFCLPKWKLSKVDEHHQRQGQWSLEWSFPRRRGQRWRKCILLTWVHLKVGQQQLQRCWYWRKQQIWNLKWCSIRFVFRIFITACAFLGIMGLQAFQHWNIGEKRRGRTPRLDVLKPYEIGMLTQAVLVLLVLYTIKLHPMISYSIISHLTITISHYISLYPNISHDIIMISKSYSYTIGVYPLHLITSHYPITSHYIQYITWYHHDIQIIFFIYIQYIHYILYIYIVFYSNLIYIYISNI